MTTTDSRLALKFKFVSQQLEQHVQRGKLGKQREKGREEEDIMAGLVPAPSAHALCPAWKACRRGGVPFLKAW